MVSVLDGKLRKSIARAFRGKLKRGLIRNYDSAQLDDFGDATFPEPAEEARFEGIREDFNAAWAAQAGIPDTDVSVLVILGSIRPQTVEPRQDSLVYVSSLTQSGKWCRVRRVLSVDPADATMRLQCTVMNPQPE